MNFSKGFGGLYIMLKLVKVKSGALSTFFALKCCSFSDSMTVVIQNNPSAPLFPVLQ